MQLAGLCWGYESAEIIELEDLEEWITEALDDYYHPDLSIDDWYPDKLEAIGYRETDGGFMEPTIRVLIDTADLASFKED